MVLDIQHERTGTKVPSASSHAYKDVYGFLSHPYTHGLPPSTSVNLPHLLPGEPDPEVVFCQPCTKPLPVNYRIEGNEFYYVGEYAKRDRTLGSDVDVCFSGKIAVTQLTV